MQRRAAPVREAAAAWRVGARRLSALQAPIAGIPIGWLLLFLVFANLMLAFPGIDLAVARWFYTPGEGFKALGTPWERALYRSVPVLMVAGNVALVLVWALNLRRARRGAAPLLGLDGRRLALLLCLLALLPGLVINQGFKEHWGRARPVQVSELGGDRPFTPAFVHTGRQGGSFSSGHVAAAAYLIAVAHLLAGPRSGWLAAAVLYTALVGLARMAAGGHFLSDVLTSVFLVLLGYLLLRHVLCRGAEPAPAPRAATGGGQ